MTTLDTIQQIHPDLIAQFFSTGQCAAIPHDVQLYLQQLQWAAEINETEHNVQKAADKLRDRHRTTKSSVVFALPHEEGSLSQVLSIFSFYKINLTKIQSLPIIGREWEYMFYIDVMYDDYTRYRQSIDAVRPLTKQLKVLGEYKEGKETRP